jgi:hypothetical protein
LWVGHGSTHAPNCVECHHSWYCSIVTQYISLRCDELTTRVECCSCLCYVKFVAYYNLFFLLSMWQLDLMLTTSPRFLCGPWWTKVDYFKNWLKKILWHFGVDGVSIFQGGKVLQNKIVNDGFPMHSMEIRCMVGESTLWWTPLCSHIVLFCWVVILNLNHVKTTKDFHNVFAYYGKA